MKALPTIFNLLFFTFCFFSQENQNVELAKLTSGKFTVHKVVEKSYHNYKFETASKPWPVSFTKSGETFSEILIKRAGIIDELYKSDLPNYPSHYLNPQSEIVVTVINKKIYYYRWSIKTGSEIKYILTEKSPEKYEDEKTNLDNYRTTILIQQEETRQDRIEENAEEAAQEYAENTLKGKDIKSIKIQMVNPPDKIGLLTIVSIGFEAQLANGTILKTKNIGGKTPYTDFKIITKGGDFAGGDFKVANDSKEIPNDQIELEVQSVFNNGPKVSYKYPINYKSDIFYQFQGKSGQNGRGMTVGYSVDGGNGMDGRSINITASLKTINGESVNEIIITDAFSGELIATSKLHIDHKITINVNGGNGGSGERGASNYSHDGGNGGDGGNAGNVMLSGNGASLLDITVYSTGGNGGSGGEGKTAANSDGSKGYSGSNGNLIR